MAKIIAKLVKGQDYYILGNKFTNGKEVEIDESLKVHLVDNPQFEFKEIEETPENNEGDKETSKDDEELEAPENNEEAPKRKGMVLKNKGDKNKQEGDE